MFDIFISHKHTDNGIETRDYSIATDLYNKLTALGYNCFFSGKTLANQGESNYGDAIDNALDEAKIFILVATNISYVNSNYIKHEWNSFYEEIKSGRKEGAQMFTYIDGINIGLLPLTLRNKQSCKIGIEEELLIQFVTSALPLNNQVINEPVKSAPSPVISNSEPLDNSVYSREGIADLLIDKIHKYKYPYLIYSKVDSPEKRENFLKHAKSMFQETITGYYHGKTMDNVDNMIDIIVDEMSSGEDSYVRVEGLPGSAKNMILQLVFYKMLENFKSGVSNYLPFYLSASYYEKLNYNPANVREDMKNTLSKVFHEYFKFLSENPNVKPVLLIEALRHHRVSKFAPEDIVNELWRPYGRFNRACAIDVGLIKNKTRHKRNIALELNKNGYVFTTKQIPIDDSVSSIKLINSVFNMYPDEYSYIDAVDTYNRLKEFQFPTIDIFLVRLIATGYMGRRLGNDTFITDVYENMAFEDIKKFPSTKSDEENLRYISEELCKCVYETSSYSFNDSEYNAALWSLPHKHSTYMEFLIAYYFIYRIEHYEEYSEQNFFSRLHTSMSNHFVTAYIKDYDIQETFLRFILENYNDFNIQQKSNAAYWLGRINHAALKNEATNLLTNEYANLKKDIESNNKTTQENCNNHFLFRSICNGLHAQNQANMMDGYLRIVVSNDVANAINRGAIIEYYSENYTMLSHDTYNLDTDLSVGEQSIKILNSRIESVLYNKVNRFVEIDLVTVLCLLQARIQNVRSEVKFDVKPYVKKAIEYLERYHSTIANVSSPELIDYFKSVEDDLRLYLKSGAFDIGPLIYNRYRTLKQIKRSQWLEHDIYDPESVSEHSFSAWMMAMFFLPEECEDSNYSKREILDMLLVHDMAEADTGDKLTSLSESTQELGEQNFVLKKLFLKGTYPDIANLTYYYRVWNNYYNGSSINAKTARDINLLQSIYTFFEYYCQYPEQFVPADLNKWIAERQNFKTNLGHELFERLIIKNKDFEEILASIGM